MGQLKQTRVYRSGLTAPNWYTETTECSASVDKNDGSLSVNFDIASKGGGTTCLWVKIGSADVRSLLHELAEKRPDTSQTFAECVTMAIQLNDQMLDKIRDSSVMKKLESVAELVEDRCGEVPVGENDVEEAAREDLGYVIRTVKSVN